MNNIEDKLFMGFLITAITAAILVVLGTIIWVVGFWILLVIPITLACYLIGTFVMSLEQDESVKQSIQKDIDSIKNGFRKNG